jgi:hypothetical protein
VILHILNCYVNMSAPGVPLPGDLYCHLCYEDGKAIDVRPDEDPKPIGYGWKVDGRDVREYIYSCRCPAGAIPTSVTLIPKTTPGQVDRSCMPVQVH